MPLTLKQAGIVKESLARLKEKDTVTYNHSMRVGMLVTEYWERKMADREILNDISAGAFLHDIGKLYEKDSVLNNPGQLEGDQWKEMKNHPGYGAAFLPEELKKNSIIRDSILQHHESYDPGAVKGYPLGIGGDKISEYAQVVAVADVFDACLNKRQYKEEMSLDQVLDIINRDRKLNPVVAGEFTDMVRQKVVNNELSGEQDPLYELRKIYEKDKEENTMGLMTKMEERLKDFRKLFEEKEPEKVTGFVGRTGDTINLTRAELRLAMEQTKKEIKDLRDLQKAILDKAKETGVFNAATSKSYERLSGEIFSKTVEYSNQARDYGKIDVKRKVENTKEQIEKKASFIARVSIDKALSGIGAIRHIHDGLKKGIKEFDELRKSKVRDSVIFMDLGKSRIQTQVMNTAESVSRKQLAISYAINEKAIDVLEKNIAKLEKRYQHQAGVRDAVKNVFNAIRGKEQLDLRKSEMTPAQLEKLGRLKDALNNFRGENHNLEMEFNQSRERSIGNLENVRDKHGAVGKEEEVKEFDDMIAKVKNSSIEKDNDHAKDKGKDMEMDVDLDDL